MAQGEMQPTTDAIAAPESLAVAPAVPRAGGVFVDTLLSLFVPTLVLATLDAFGSTAVLAGADRLTNSLLLLAYVLPLFFFVSAFIAAGWAVLLRLRALAEQGGLPQSQGLSRGAAWAAALPVAAVGCALVFALSYVSATSFENHALAALLCTLVALAAAAPLYALWLGTFAALVGLGRRLEARPELRWLALWGVAAAPLALVLWALVRKNATGLDTISHMLWIGPLAAVAALGPCVVLGRRTSAALRGRLRLALWVALAASVGLARVVSYKSVELSQVAVRGALLSAKLLVAARFVTDVDRDGASSMFGDADCAPLDAKIHPLARDIPGDGIDSNCLGGDARPEPAEPAPQWLDDFRHAQPRNLVVITVEAVRADHMSFLGYRRETMPVLSAFARKSQVFERSYAGSNATVMSMLSFWSGRPATQIKGARAAGAPVWIPRTLQREGFRTSAALVSWKRFDTLDRGFDRFDMTTQLRIDGGFRDFPDGKLIDDTIAFIEQNKAGRFLAWAHLVGPHHVYERAPGAPNFGDAQADLYDSELWAADREIGRLLSYLEKAGLLEQSLVIITGDHGEALGEHGVETHHETLFDVELHTMTVMYVPRLAARFIPQPVLLRDVSTTAMNLLGVRRGFSQLRGRNLLPLFAGQQIENSTLFLEMVGYKGDPKKIAALQWPFKLHYDVKSSRRELYHLVEDPKELREVGASHPAVLADLSQRIARHLEQKP